MARFPQDAACRPGSGVDPELFFPIYGLGTNQYHAQAAEAIAVCRTCPVISECLNFAVDNRVNDGVFGGMTAEQRREISRAARTHAPARSAAHAPRAGAGRRRIRGYCRVCRISHPLRRNGDVGRHHHRLYGAPCAGGDRPPIRVSNGQVCA